jgi:uroporphyrinogen-III synthase
VRPRLLVLRSGERPFTAGLVPGLDLLERRTHDLTTLSPASPIAPFDLVLFTSGAAVERFLARGDLAPLLERSGVYGVGPATARILRGRGVASVRDGGGSARALLECLPEDLVGSRVLLPRGDDADNDLPAGLEARGAEVVTLTLYRKKRLPYDPALDEAIASRPPAAFFATSPDAARWLFDGMSRESAARLRRTPAIALGPPTAYALSENGVERVEIARPATFESAARLAVRLAGGPPAT